MFYIRLFVLTVFSSCYGLVDVGKYLKICDRNSVDVNDCLVDAIQDGLPVLSDGIKEMGLPPIDPYRQKELKIEYKNNQISAKMVMMDIVVEGLREATVHDARLRADEDNFYLEADLTSPRVFVKGRYSGEGGYSSLVINTTGEFNVTMKNLVYTWKIGGKPEKRDNETYIRINTFYMRPDVGDLKSYLSNDNPETQEIINLANSFANANWKTLYRELLPYVQENWNKIGIRVANKIFLKVPYDVILPAKS